MSAVHQLHEVSLNLAEDIVRDIQQLPSAPKVLPRLSQLLEDADSSIDDIVSLVRLDPGISARVLQVANSVYYSKGIRIYSVEEAVLRVGYTQVYDMVAYAVASRVVNRPLFVYGLEADELWRQAVSCALAAETLAVCLGEDRNVAYTAGLLHGVGMVVINEWALQHQPVLLFTYRGLPREYIESERALLGFTQAEVGAALLDSWDFPQTMVGPVRWQYNPMSSISHMRMAALLHAAKWIRSAVCSDLGNPPLPDPFAIQVLRINPSLLHRIAQDVRLRLLAVRHLLELQ